MSSSVKIPPCPRTGYQVGAVNRCSYTLLFFRVEYIFRRCGNAHLGAAFLYIAHFY